MNSEVIGETQELKKVDRYGFFEEDTTRSQPVYDTRLENQRLKKWLEMLKNWKIYRSNKPELIKRRIRKGIPDAIRGRVWSLLISADVCTDIYNQYYEDLLANHLSQEDNDFTRKGGVIDRDINRTYPSHESYTVLKGSGQEALKNVLMAFADHDKELKYTQGMNYIVGVLLNYLTEEEAFWSLRQLMENTPYLMSCWFNQELIMVHISHFQMIRLIDKYLPKIGQYLTDVNVSPAMYTTEWFMCVFTRSFPYDVVVRVWDIYLAEGWVIVYQVALALLKIFSNIEEFMGKEFEVVYSIISGINHSALLPSADIIIKMALTFKITDVELEKLRIECIHSRMKKITLS